KGQASGVHDFGNEGLYFVVAVDLVDRDRHLLHAAAGEGYINVAFGIEGWVGNRMQAIGNGLGNLDLAAIADVAVGLDQDLSRLCSWTNLGNQKIFRAHYDGAGNAGKADFGPRELRRLEAPANDPHLASRQGGGRLDGVDVGIAVHIFSAQEAFRDAHRLCHSSRQNVSPDV